MQESSPNVRPSPIIELDIELLRLDMLDPESVRKFENYKSGFLNVLANAFGSVYYGDEYHINRIIEERAIVYFALARDEVIGASYVKRNRRRGATAVYPRTYRRLGVAEALIAASFHDFPQQYSILAVSHVSMTTLLLKMGFVRATSVDKVREITEADFSLLCDFAVSDVGVVFQRRSERRDSNREMLTLLYRHQYADAR